MATVVVATGAWGGLAHAQAVASTTKPGGDGPGPREGGTAAPSTMVHGAPKTYQVVRVAVPASLPENVPLTWEFVPFGNFSIISAHRGTVAPASDSARSVLVIFGIPSRSRAGVSSVGEMRFRTPDGRTEVVTVQVDIAAVRDVSIRMLQELRGITPGRSVTVQYQITNNGNGPDTLTLRHLLPAEWRMEGPFDAALVLESRATVERVERLRVPATASAGSYSVLVDAIGSDGALRNAGMSLFEIHGRDLSRRPGMLVTTSYSRTSGGSFASALTGFSLSGAIYRDVNIATDISTGLGLGSADKYRLSRVGQFPQRPNVSLFTPRWRMRYGAVGASFSELTGQNAGGQGWSYTFNDQSRSLQTFYARPEDAGGAFSVGERGGVKIGGNWLTTTVAHLDEGSASQRRLDVAGVAFAQPDVLGGSLMSETAYRRFTGGEGLGVLEEYTRMRAEERLQIRFLHSPGGTSAFSNATSNLTASFTHRLNPRWLLDAQGWGTQNDVRGNDRSSAYGIDVGPQYELSRALSVAVTGGQSEQTLTASAIQMGSTDRHVGTSLHLQGNGFAFWFGPSVGLLSRTAATENSPEATTTSMRSMWQAALSKGTAQFGTLSANGSIINDQTNSMGFPRQDVLALRLDNFPLYFVGGYHIIATGVVQRLGYFGDRPTTWGLRGDLRAELPLGVSLVFSADRSPIAGAISGNRWITSLRIVKSGILSVPDALRFGTRGGVVYEDLNGNGRRDDGEPGLEGVIVERGRENVITDAGGGFRFTDADKATDRLRVDPRSLPMGWIETPLPISEDAARKVHDIGIMPTSQVQVRVVLRREDMGEAGAIDLSKVVVAARDSLGRLWYAQPSLSGVHTFGALPPGSYTVEVDPSGVGAPVSVRTTPPPFRVGAKNEAMALLVELGTRRVRMNNFQNQGTTAGPPQSGASPSPSLAAPGRPLVRPTAAVQPDSGVRLPPRRAEVTRLPEAEAVLLHPSDDRDALQLGRILCGHATERRSILCTDPRTMLR